MMQDRGTAFSYSHPSESLFTNAVIMKLEEQKQTHERKKKKKKDENNNDEH